ncbi:Lrp/AsnC family transcriptional regulator [Streptomyces avermitilis]
MLHHQRAARRRSGSTAGPRGGWSPAGRGTRPSEAWRHGEALLWITVAPGGLEETGRQLSRHPQVRFVSATTGPVNLLVALAATDLNALHHFLSDTLGALSHLSTIEVTPILSGVKRTGLVRPGSL